MFAIGVGCDGPPIELRFVSAETDDQRNSDRIGEEEPDAPAEPEAPADAAADEPAFEPGPACDDFPNGCSLEEQPKCTLVSNDPGYRSACVRPRGERSLGQACERRVRGDDDCAAGGFCSPIGRGFEDDNRLICRRLCATPDDCENGERCLQLQSAEAVGVCVAECTVFEDDCGSEDLRCVAALETTGSYFGYCEIFGSRQEGESCTLTSQCEDGASCEFFAQTCRMACDGEHPCAEDRRCLPLELVPGSLRLCVP